MHAPEPPSAFTCAQGEESTRLHYWIQRDQPHMRMNLRARSQANVVCAFCGISYWGATSMSGCPGTGARVG